MRWFDLRRDITPHSEPPRREREKDRAVHALHCPQAEIDRGLRRGRYQQFSSGRGRDTATCTRDGQANTNASFPILSLVPKSISHARLCHGSGG
jgi:hypothetical protein